LPIFKEDGGDEYVLCYVKKTIYILNKTGKVLFFKNLDLTISSSDSFSLLCYKYDQGTNRYLFFIIISSLYNNISKLIINSYNLLIINENQGELTLLSNITHFPELDSYNYSIIPGGISCKIMLEDSSKVIVCFIGITVENNAKPLSSLRIDPSTFQISLNGIIGGETWQISSSIGKDKSKALVCLLNSSGAYKCFSYDVNQKTFSENEIFEISCKIDNYVIYTFYFPDTNEFIASCLDYSNNYNMKKIDQNFSLVQEEYLKQSKFNCINLYSFSVVYVNKYKEYILISYGIRNMNYVFGVSFFELSNNCKIGNIKNISEPKAAVIILILDISAFFNIVSSIKTPQYNYRLLI
jgi:hypothetical protein